MAVSLKYAGSRTVCRKSDDNCDCAGQIPTDPLCVDFDRDKIFARAVRTVPLSGGAAGGQGAATLGNGDVNGDNGLDLSDPIYLLTFLFQGGPAPLPCPGSGGGAGIPSVVNVGRLPSTLTDNCYEEVFPDDWGTAADCDAAIASCPGQDSFYQQVAENVHSCYGQSSSVDRFVINGDGTVTDHCTNLMWARGRPWPVPEPGGRIEWAEALAWSETLVYTTSRAFKPEAQAVLDGDEIAYDGWRMPNIRELETIADFDLAGQNLAGTLQARRALYWSSTTIPSRPDLVFGLGGHGPARLHVKKNDPRMHIRPCRTITPPP